MREEGEEEQEEQTTKRFPPVSKTEKIERSDILKEIEKDHTKEKETMCQKL